MLKACVTHSERFIDNQDLRRSADCHRKGQANIHATRIYFDRLVDERAQFSEAFDLRKHRLRLLSREAHQRSIHEDVFNPREFHVKAGTQFEQSGNSAFMPDGSVRRLECAGHYLKQGGFAAAVWADDTGRSSGFNLKTDVLEGPKLAM